MVERQPGGGPGAVPAAMVPMLASPDGGRLPDDPRFSYEFKWDGCRAIMRVAPDGATLLNSRNGNDFTTRFPELTGVMTESLVGQAAVLDGEIVALDEQGRPEFGLLQNRQAQPTAVSYLVFDVLRLGESLLLDQPYRYRREVLERLAPVEPGLVSISPAHSHAALSSAGITPQALLGWPSRTGWRVWCSRQRSRDIIRAGAARTGSSTR